MRVLAVLAVAGGTWRVALARAGAGPTAWGADPSTVRRGEIVIKPTGRTVRVITLAAGRPAPGQSTQVRVIAAAATAPSTGAARTVADDGCEYTERGVRLPLAYDPRDNFGYGCGPVTYAPLFCGPGYGYDGGYGYTGYRYAGYDPSRSWLCGD